MLAEFRKLLRECGFHEIGISYRQGVLHLQRSLSPRRGFGSSQEAVALFDQALARGRRGLRLEPQPPGLSARIALHSTRLREARGRSTHRTLADSGVY